MDAYIESFGPFLMDVIHAWSRVRHLTRSCSML